MASATYNPQVLQLFAELPGAGDLPAGEGTLVEASVQALDRLSWLELRARVEDGRITQCSFRAWACPHTLAATALVVAGLQGLPANAPAPDVLALSQPLVVPAHKRGRLLALQDAVTELLQRAAALG